MLWKSAINFGAFILIAMPAQAHDCGLQPLGSSMKWSATRQQVLLWTAERCEGPTSNVYHDRCASVPQEAIAPEMDATYKACVIANMPVEWRHSSDGAFWLERALASFRKAKKVDPTFGQPDFLKTYGISSLP